MVDEQDRMGEGGSDGRGSPHQRTRHQGMVTVTQSVCLLSLQRRRPVKSRMPVLGLGLPPLPPLTRCIWRGFWRVIGGREKGERILISRDIT